jgi:hypothetical protein
MNNLMAQRLFCVILSTCVREAGGEAEVGSEAGQGSFFGFTLPMQM